MFFWSLPLRPGCSLDTMRNEPKLAFYPGLAILKYTRFLKLTVYILRFFWLQGISTLLMSLKRMKGPGCAELSRECTQHNFISVPGLSQ